MKPKPPTSLAPEHQKKISQEKFSKSLHRASQNSSGERKNREITLQELHNMPRKPGASSLFYWDSVFQHNAVKVLPGEYFVSDYKIMITTLLGSCISVCLWDNQIQAGGMNHFMLPEQMESTSLGRYGSYAMELLIDELLKKGSKRNTMKAKIFGGGRVMHNIKSIDVGARNAEFALQYLNKERIVIDAQDVLNIYPRKVCFFPTTGQALVKRLPHTHPEAPKISEEMLGSVEVMARKTYGGKLELFQ